MLKRIINDDQPSSSAWKLTERAKARVAVSSRERLPWPYNLIVCCPWLFPFNVIHIRQVGISL